MSNYDERLYEQFQKEKESFHRWLFVALLLSVFYVFVFQPYLSLLNNIAELELKQLDTDARIKTTEIEIDNAKYAIERASEFMGDASEYQRLYDDAHSWIDSMDEIEQTYELQSRLIYRLHDSLNSRLQKNWQPGNIPNFETIKLLKKYRPELMRNHQPKDECFFRLDVDWVRCQVERKRKPINDKLFRVLYDRSLAHEYTALLQADIESNKNKFIVSLPKALAEASLKQWMTEYLAAEQTIIRNWYEYMAEARLNLESKSKLHQEVKKRHKLAETKLDQRKKDLSQTGEVSTPIGTIKLAFHDLVSLVPFLELFVLSVLVRSTCRQLLLRTTFENNGPKDETTHEALSLTMPVWLEPFHSRVINAILLFLLALLALFAPLGLWQVLNNPGLAVAEMKSNHAVIITSTILIGIIFSVLYGRLLIIYLSLIKP